jgi:hypothetical protein
VVPAFAEPDIHSLSQIPRNHHRRLSVCSLPVLKQFGKNLGSLIFVAQSATGRTWRSERCVILSFPQAAVSMQLRSCELPQARSPVVPDPRRADTRPSSELRQAWLDCHSLSGSLFHKPGPDRGPAGARTWGFNQRPFDIFVALFGKWGARHLVGGALS